MRPDAGLPIDNSADAYRPRQAGLHYPQPPRFASVDEERLHRKQRLAAACRVFARAGFGYGFAGHITVRDPQAPDTFWTNPFAMDFGQVRVSDLLRVDHDGQVIEGRHTVNRAGFVLHSAIHVAHPHVLASCHMHTVNGMAWAAFGAPLAPINQTACYFYEDQAVITEGAGRVALEQGAGDPIAQALGTAKIAIHQNHGLFAVGRESVDEAAWWFLSAERACEIQLKVEAVGRAPVRVEPERARHIAHKLATPGIAWLHWQPHYDAVCRSDPDLFD